MRIAYKYEYNLTYEGRTYESIKQASDDLGICTRKLRHRLQYSGHCLSTAMGKTWDVAGSGPRPLVGNRPHTYKDKTFTTVFQIAEEFNFAYGTLTNLLRKHTLTEIVDKRLLKPRGTRGSPKR